ncbi:hypothetical protein ASPACDRAFT_47030 [Aspergillus aculeatus ATCC 16872]|uniref:Uncharacterized protein n=1 Tax=Aspergillus aculeatus (strain ATCC 16872 / CBS 172.66 / WB 5094) TaxID=690307 RepID=A0A1L9WJC3_ASPA1|nr:uncharacterized protein ASPACDRAFT_47030 [Aspergillus aculeatus ATCC 16872]OJJ96260.1 hypothetical protein ASPACDRAFT_47030 [Aspergillus aculeatus ATCC 16872]
MSMSRSQSHVPDQPRPFLQRVTDIGRLPYGGLPGRCVYGPDDPPAHFDATLTNHFVRQHLEASLSWDGHHLLQLLEQNDVENMRVMDGYRPLVLELDQYLARFWCRADNGFYYFVCTKLQGLEYCSRFVKWVNVKSTLHPVVEATTGPGLQPLSQELDDQFNSVRDQLLHQIVQLQRTMETRPSPQALHELQLQKEQYVESVVLEQKHRVRASQQQQVQHQQVQQQHPQKEQPHKRQPKQQMQGFHKFRLVQQQQPQQRQPMQPMQEFHQYPLVQQELQRYHQQQ